ncbi:hypothetical protein PanWU01x14_045650, partial [Parasponia andersonii]
SETHKEKKKKKKKKHISHLEHELNVYSRIYVVSYSVHSIRTKGQLPELQNLSWTFLKIISIASLHDDNC